MKFFVFAVLAAVAVTFASADLKDVNTDQYTATAIIILPYAGISEPVTVYYDKPNGRSRTEYYDGQDIYQRYSSMYGNGALFQTVPETLNNAEVNIMTCFQTNGTSDSPIGLQSMLPDLSNFKKVNETYVRGVKVDDFLSVTTQDGRTNTYHIYVDRVRNMPIQFHMFGYDDLFGSHYDEYVINFFSWISGPIANTSVFDVPAKCGNFPGPGNGNVRGGLAMVEDYDQHEKETRNAFANFMQRHKKSYNSTHEHHARLNNFRQNLRYIESKNRQNLGFKLAVNHLADYHKEELKIMRGSRSSPKTAIKNKSLVGDMDPIDWRDKGAVSPVKDQGICGSCWSFATAETIEGVQFLRTKNIMPLSQQCLMDCSWGYGNNACDGGEAERAFQYIIDNGGIPTEVSYGVYKMADGYCHPDKAVIGAKLQGYVNVTSGNQQEFYEALAQQGPLSVAIDASHLSFAFYSSGVYYEPSCGNTPDRLDHAVLAVGYGVDAQGGPYWIVKNSWSEYWGDQGFVKMSTKDNNCGVATDANYPILA